ncbi:MAG: diguanylate cyclase [Rhodocyclaceae bacterium]|nr:diguanylate cyclase [Rhodocyclaceae bacterium]
MAGAPGESGEAVRHSDVALLRVRRLVLLLAGLTVALYLGGVFHYLRTDQASRLEGLESLARDKVDSAAENVKATLNLFDFALRNARIAVLSGPDELEFQARLIMDTLPEGLVYQLFHVGPDGRAAYSSLGPTPPNYLGDRDYYRLLAATRADEDPLVISNPVLGRLSNKWSVQVARAVYRDGRFAGLVSLAVSPEKWTDTLRHFKIGERDVLALVNSDGGLVLRTAGLGEAYGRKVPPDRPFLSSTDAAGAYDTRGFGDGIERHYAWQRLSTGLIVVAGMSVDEALAEGRRVRHLVLAGAAAGTLGFLAAISGIFHLIGRSAGAARRIEENEARQRAILSTIGDGLAIVSPKGEHLFHNDAYREQFGGPGAHQTHVIVDAAGETLDAARMPGFVAARSGTSIDNLTLGVRLPDGRLRWLIAQARPLFHAGAAYPHGAVQITRDITELRAALEAAQISKLAFEAAGEGIVVTDSDGAMIEVNPAFSRITGYPRQVAMGLKVSILSVAERGSQALAGMLEVVAASGSWEGELPSRRQSGEEFVAFYRISCLADAGGRVSHFVVLLVDCTERKLHDDMVWRQANFDALTGLPNRVLLTDRLAQMLRRSRRAATMVGVLFIDLDRFKPVNDNLGHAAGDELLRQVAHRLLNLFRDEDTCARLGGDEFVILLPELREQGNLERMAQNTVETLSLPYRLDEAFVEIGCSVGLAAYPEDGEDVEALLQFADEAMYRAKARGRGVWSR